MNLLDNYICKYKPIEIEQQITQRLKLNEFSQHSEKYQGQI